MNDLLIEIDNWLLYKNPAYRKTINQFFRFVENLDYIETSCDFLNKISKNEIDEFVILCKQKKNKKSTISFKLTVLRCLFKHLFATGYCTNNPTENITIGNVERREKDIHNSEKIIAQNDIKKIIYNAINERDAVLFEFIYSLGLRMHEALNLTWNDFYYVGDKVYVSILGKGNKTRHNEVPLKLYKKLVLLETKDYIFLSNRGSKLSVRACDKNFKIACERAGLSKEYSVGYLRNSFLYNLLCQTKFEYVKKIKHSKSILNNYYFLL